jgi:hypothetical protein
MSMSDWTISNTPLENAGETGWVYYVNRAITTLHISRYAFDVFRDHVATNDGLYYYFPNTNSFNTDVPAQIKQALQDAWSNFFTVT